MRTNQGQSLLEAIVAIGIIVTSISSALTLISNSIRAEKESEFSVTAGNLAREGVEVVRNIRDSNWLAGRPWDDGLAGAGFDYTGVPAFTPAANAWQIQFAADALGDDQAQVFRYSTGTGGPTVGLYVQAAAQPADTVATPYRRLATLDPICDDGSIKTSGAQCDPALKIGLRASVTVQWLNAGRPRQVTAEERLYDWR